MRCTIDRNIITPAFFNRDPSLAAADLLGAVIYRNYNGKLLSARIIETESYYFADKGSHASLGRTKTREPLFMGPGTVYMYYARGGDSLNFSCRGEGNAVLVKSAYAADAEHLDIMLSLNPHKNGTYRKPEKLCSGQTLLCRTLQLKVPDWTGTLLPVEKFYLEYDKSCKDMEKIQTTRLGIPEGRDEGLMQRFILKQYAGSTTSNPLQKRKPVPVHFFHSTGEILWNRTAAYR